MTKTNKAVWSVLAMLTIWCTWNSSKINNTIDEQITITNVVNSLVVQYEEDEDETSSVKTEKSFEDAFSEAREKYGSGRVFMWQGEYYTTDYSQEQNQSMRQDETNIDGWVLNSDDIDDYCKSNNHDECGVCDGPGITTWYADRDRDGLGDENTYRSGCDEPIVVVRQ